MSGSAFCLCGQMQSRQEAAGSSPVAPAIVPHEDSMPATWLLLSTGEKTPETSHASSSRKRWKERRPHLGREFLEHAHGPRDVAVAQMNQPEMEIAEMPIR
jgi:hypothetical protein